MSDDVIPTDIRQQGPRQLGITWSDGAESSYDVRALRLACGCAQCVDEWTGDETLDPASVPEDVHPLSIQSVGRSVPWTVDLSRQLGRRLLRTQFCGSSLPVEAPRHGGKPGLRNNPLGFFSGGSALGARGGAIPDLADPDGGQIESGATNRTGPRGRAAFESGHSISPLWSCLEGGASSRHRELPSPARIEADVGVGSRAPRT